MLQSNLKWSVFQINGKLSVFQSHWKLSVLQINIAANKACCKETEN